MDKDVITLGSSLDNDLVVPSPRVSPHHAEIRLESGEWLIKDLASRHGTLLNGQRVREPAGLRPGDEVALPGAVLQLDEPEREATGRRLPPRRPGPRESGSREAAGEASSSEMAAPVLVGDSPAIQLLREKIDRVADSTATVLIRGESGTGKEIVAELIHHRSARRGRPFVVVNCPALPGSLIELELFGVEKGVATGVEPRPGLLEVAQGGTLLLDEVGDLDPSAQAKLLRFLQDHKVQRIGGRRPSLLDVRILAATNQDLEAAVEAGRFRGDLYHRLNTVTLHAPPLRDRRDDVPLLVRHFLARGPEPALPVSAEALERLSRHPFPGNVRELERMVERARIFRDGPAIDLELSPELLAPRPPAQAGGQQPQEAAAQLYERVVQGGESFWDVVHRPFLARTLGAEPVRHLVARCYREAGRSNRQMARLFRLDDVKQYKRLTAFLRNHGLIVPRRRADQPAAG